MKNIFFLACLVSLTAACGKKEEEKFQYSFTENGCETKEHKADTKDKYCAMLRDDALNNYCASRLRKEAYEKNGCGTWPF
jgi:uncharacterized lipoprotein YehR (DUF1307 family)